MLDEAGEKWPVVDFPLQLFDTLYRQQSTAAKLPDYSLSRLELDGEVADQRIRFKAIFRIATFVAGPVVVPMQLGQVQIEQDPKLLEGEGQAVVRFNETLGGYDLILTNQVAQTCAIELTCVAPIRQIGTSSKLRLSIPQATTSLFSLRLPDKSLSIHADDVGLVDQKSDSESQATDLTFRGLPAEFELLWSDRPAEPTSSNALFEVSSSIEIQVDDRGALTCDAQCELSSFNPPLQEVRLRLPTSYRLLETDYQRYLVRAEGPPEAGYQNHSIVFRESSPSGTESIRLRLQISKDAQGQFELTDFEFPDALSQSGVVRIFSSGDQRMKWTPGRFARRISDVETAIRPRATFEFSRPRQLRLELKNEQTSLTVQPEYVVTIAEMETRVTAIFRFRSRGAKPSQVQFDLRDWELLDVGPELTVRNSEVWYRTEQDEQEPLAIPLMPSISDQFEVRITARKTLENVLPANESGEAGEVFLDLPIAQIDRGMQLQSTIVVTSEPNVAVQQAELSNGEFQLVALPEELQSELPPNHRTPLSFRMMSVGPVATLPLLAATLQQDVRWQSQIKILSLQSRRLRVRQAIEWKIANVPLPVVEIRIPDSILQDGDLRMFVDGQATPIERGLAGLSERTDRVRARVPLPAPAMGTFVTSFEFYVPVESDGVAQNGSSMVVDAPLILPANEFYNFDEQTERFRVLQSQVVGYRVQVDAGFGQWTLTDASGDGDPAATDIIASADIFQETLPLRLEPIESIVSSESFELMVDRAWFQTWCTNDDRQDRSVYRIVGTPNTLRMRLPESYDVQRLKVHVDQQLVEFERAGDFIEFPLPPARSDERTVELLHYQPQRPRVGSMQFDFPRIDGAEMQRRWFWRLVVPKSECLITRPSNLLPAQRWVWSRFVPTWRGGMTQQKLESWSSAMRSEPTVLAGSHEYLFGALGPVEPIEVRTIAATNYILICSGLVLVVGLFLIYLRSQFRVYALILLAALLAAGVGYSPEAAAAFGQAAMLGFVLVLLASSLSWLLRRSALEVALRRDAGHSAGGVPIRERADLLGSTSLRQTRGSGTDAFASTEAL